ncbi:unnamed protein product [Schistosoma curassoni]|uniref:Uncharacterized protein n=1 Tax=Schistosoma curassoni TaxID=6186 RepID=A0A183JQH3_9TREM|nr:unnamed protein product [Schistosoma curassoni]
MPNCSIQDARTACTNYKAVNELDIQSMNISNTLLIRHDETQSQGRTNLRSFNSDSNFRENMKGDSTSNRKASLVNVYPVANFILVIHVHFVMQNVLNVVR